MTIPSIYVEDSEEHMTSDIAIDLFDFGQEMNERRLDDIALSMKVGESREVECRADLGYTLAEWTITIRRAE